MKRDREPRGPGTEGGGGGRPAEGPRPDPAPGGGGVRRRASAGPARVVVLGLGNPLLADDGVGLAALERLRASWTLGPGAELVDGGTWGMMLLPAVEDAERLLLLDAIDVGAPAGETVVLEREELPLFLDGKLSAHQVGIREVLALASLRGSLPSETVAMGLQPAGMATETALSRPAAEGLDDLVERAIERLRAWGVEARPRAPGGPPPGRAAGAVNRQDEGR